MTNTNIIRQIKEQYSTNTKELPNPDSVLQHYMKSGEFTKQGTADKIMDVYNWSHDRQAVMALFQIFTGESFDEYLRKFVPDDDYKGKEVKLKRDF